MAENVLQFRRTLPSLLKSLCEKLKPTQAENIKSGFRQCGIIPFNPEIVLNRLPPVPGIKTSRDKCSSTATSNTCAGASSGAGAVDASLMQLLSDMRGLDKSTTTRKRAKRLKVEAGKSVCFEVEQTSETGEAGNDDFEDTDSDSSSDTDGTASDDSEEQEEETIHVGTDAESEQEALGETSGVVVAAATGVAVEAGTDISASFRGVTECKQATVGTWILSKLQTDSGRLAKFFVAKIDCVYHKKKEVNVTFLKQYRSTINQFVKPDIQDTSVLSYSDIVGKLTPPQQVRRGVLQFEVDSREWRC